MHSAISKIILLICCLGTGCAIQGQVLKPSPVPETPAPPAAPPASTASNIDFPVSAPAPDLSLVENEVCDWFGGSTDEIIVGPVNLGQFGYEVWRKGSAVNLWCWR